jgi:hypothetical protein
VIAVDIDLRRIVAWDGVADTVATMSAHPADAGVAILKSLEGQDASERTVLIEVASPVDFAAGQQRRLAWALWNIFAATTLDTMLAANGCAVLVCPSTIWTKRYPEAVRNKLVGPLPVKLNKRDEHDLQACRAMLHFCWRDPAAWVPLAQYMQRL